MNGKKKERKKSDKKYSQTKQERGSSMFNYIRQGSKMQMREERNPTTETGVQSKK